MFWYELCFDLLKTCFGFWICNLFVLDMKSMRVSCIPIRTAMAPRRRVFWRNGCSSSPSDEAQFLGIYFLQCLHLILFRKTLKNYISLQGVSVTNVILAPGARGCGLRAALLDTTSGSPVDRLANSKKRRSYAQASYLSARRVSKPGPAPSEVPGEASGIFWEQMDSNWDQI